MRYVEYDVWTGCIYRVSSIPSLPTKSTTDVIKVNDPIIEDMSDDKRSLASAFIGTDLKAYDKNGTIHLPKSEKEFSIISTEKNNKPDVTINLYTNNKLMEIAINYSALKTWYNHRMKKDFKFAYDYKFEFKLQNKDIIKHIKFTSKDFLETFETTIDLSDVKDLSNIKILTKRKFPNYFLNIKKNKYITSTENTNINIKKTEIKENLKQIYDITIVEGDDNFKIKNNIPNLILNKIYKQINFYITGKDPNELYEVITIPIKELWETKKFIFKKNYSMDDKLIWSDNNITVLFKGE